MSLTRIRFPKTADEALANAIELDGEYRAGGTDLQDRRQHLRQQGRGAVRPLVDLRDVPGLGEVASDPSGAWIGALTTLADVAAHPTIRAGWPGLAEAAGALANPQIRAVATLAGSLMQAPRCWYYRHPDYTCLRKGGTSCYAREGDHLFHVCYDESPCVAPHPSTVALALLAYEAEVEVLVASSPEPSRVPILAVLGIDGLEPVGPSGLITAIRLGPPVASEQTAYVRASNRAYAEWALAEVSVRLVLAADTGTLAFVRVVAGGVAPTPRRLSAVEDALLGQRPTPERLAEAAGLARAGAKPLAMTGYKLDLLEACVLEAFERALAAAPTAAAIHLQPEPER